MAPRPRDYQYRVVWRRKHDKADRKKVFNRGRDCYRFVLRLAGEKPWHGASRVYMRRVWAFLSKQMNVPTAAVMDYSARDAMIALREGNAKVAWMRIEMRQVGAWTEMVDPMEVLKPKTLVKMRAKAEAYCDFLDEHPEKRWIPPVETK